MKPSSISSRCQPLLAVALLLCVLGAGGALWAQPSPSSAAESPRRELWLFFSPEPGPLAADLERLAGVLKKASGVVPRPVLLARDLGALRKPGKDLADVVRALQALQGEAFGLPVLDLEGLARAKELGVDHLPAYALIEPADSRGARRAAIAAGYGVKFEELLR